MCVTDNSHFLKGKRYLMNKCNDNSSEQSAQTTARRYTLGLCVINTVPPHPPC